MSSGTNWSTLVSLLRNVKNYTGAKQTATTDATNQTISCYRYDGSNIQVVPAIGFWGSWDFNQCINIPFGNLVKWAAGDWTVTAGWCGFKPDILFFRGNVSGTQFPMGIYCNVNGMYINVVEGQSQSHYGDVITVNDTGWSFNKSMAYIDGRAIKYVAIKITP